MTRPPPVNWIARIRFITRSPRRPSLPSRAGDQALGAELVFGPAVSHRRTRRSPPGCSPGPGPGCRCSMASSRAAAPCLRATMPDRPDRSAKPAGREALTAAPAPGREARDESAPGRKRSGRATEAAGSGFWSGEVGRDRVGGVAVRAVPGVVVPAGRAGVLMPGVILDIAECGAGVKRKGDRVPVAAGWLAGADRRDLRAVRAILVVYSRNAGRGTRSGLRRWP